MKVLHKQVVTAALLFVAFVTHPGVICRRGSIDAGGKS